MEREIIAFSVESITSDIEKVNIRGASHYFPQAALQELKRPDGPVDVLVGINFCELASNGSGYNGKSQAAEIEVW